MDDDMESSDISAEQLAAIRNKGQFARSISLALSANIDEESAVSPAAEKDSASYQSSCSQDGAIERDLKVQEKCVIDSDDSEDDSTSEQDTSDECDAAQLTTLPKIAPSSRPRHRTRLRQQKRRQKMTDFLAPFMRDSDSDKEGETIVEGGDRIQAVPTLTELCIQKGIIASGSLPPGLKPLLSQHHNKAGLVTLQLRWLSKNLTLLEKQIKWSLVDALKPRGVMSSILRRDARSLWRSDWWENTTGRAHQEESQWILPAGCQSFCVADWKIACLAHYINLTLPQQYANCNHSEGSSVSETEHRELSIDRDVQQVKRCLRKRYPKLVKHCFGLAIAYVWWARGRCTRAQEAFMKVANSYPADIQSDTEKSTLWARHKAMVLVEIAHMLTMFNQPVAAGQFYREAVETASKNIHPDNVTKLTLQSLVLTGSAYDQGVMDGPSASQAAGLWTAAAKQAQSFTNWADNDDDPHIERCEEDAVRAAVESLLHCHAGHLPNSVSSSPDVSFNRNREWLRSTQTSLEKLLDEKFPFVGFYLSFILAMLNEGIAAENAYHYHFIRTPARHGVPGQLARVLGDEDVRPHPWWLFEEWISEKAMVSKRQVTKPLKVLPLVWRRSLVHPCYCDGREQVTDIQGITPDLCLTSKGHLSSAMMQNLPPLGAVCIDPLNGQVNFSNSCCADVYHQWGNYVNTSGSRPKHHFSCNSALPQPNIIFTDPESTATVSLIIPGISGYYKSNATNHESMVRKKRYTARIVENINLIRRESQPVMSAIYQGSGRRLKVNIVKLVLQERKKNIMEEVSALGIYDDAKLKVVKDFVDFFIARNAEPHVQWIRNFMQEKFVNPKKSPEPQKQPSVTKADFAKYLAKVNSFCRAVQVSLKNVLYVGKATVILLLQVNNHSVFVFLDCSSPERFIQPVVRESPEPPITLYNRFDDHNSSWVLPDNIDYWKTPDEAPANVFFAFTGKSERNIGFPHLNMHLFDDKGNILSFQKFTEKKQQDSSKSRFFAACCGYKIIGTNRTKTKVTSCDIQSGVESWSSQLPRITELDVSQNTVYVSTRGGVYALDADKLKPLVIVQLKPNLYLASSNDAGVLLRLEEESSTSMKVLGPRDVIVMSDSGLQYNRTFLALDNHLLILQRRRVTDDQLLEGEALPNVLEVQDIMLPGRATELCYINEKVGIVVSATVFNRTTAAYYRENLYWFDMQGSIRAIHPFIGGGCHGFLPVYLKPPSDKDNGKNAQENKEDLYLYFADGLGALCCIKLDASQYD